MKKFIVNLFIDFFMFAPVFYLGFAFGQWYKEYPGSSMKTLSQIIIMISPKTLFWRGLDEYVFGFTIGLFLFVLILGFFEMLLPDWPKNKRTSLPGVPKA
jgi:hypothetical protein